ncbi:cell division protein ZapA [Vandammella animalimorsus]|uniref:Cell division protein ZapA n=1 Tax=Vandammella animalimorsus TaxID=2029117 RepID=A0A3M6R2Y0_9BURK|nr:cell division protein ZapA [Vandammella animalimorsus]RMX09573.1 cell division protein ZapA [Vandammella animalimorsus]
MNQVEVKILQQSYTLACKEGQEDRLHEAVRAVDLAMTRIHDTGKVRARDRIAVLAALNLAYELADLREQLQRLQAQSPHAMPTPSPSGTDHEGLALAQSQALQALVGKLDGVLAQLAPASGGVADRSGTAPDASPLVQ